MRQFGPTVMALLAGIAWLGISTTLIPAGKEERALPIAGATTLQGACGTAVMIARLPDVPEASGLVVSRRADDVLWTHNDSGRPLLYAVGTDGKPRGRVQVTGAQVDDWEDIAAGPCPEGSCLFIADIGDNKESRNSITVYRVPEPSPTDPATRPAVVVQATYPEGPHDAESLFVGPNGALYVVTKGEGSPISIYRVPPATAGGTARLERVATLDGEARRKQRITDADASPDGKWIALRTLESVEFHRATALLAGKVETIVEVDVSKIGEPQGEGIALLNDGTVYLAGEAGDGTRGGTLARLSCKLP